MGDVNRYFNYSEFRCRCGVCEYGSGRDIDPRVPQIAMEIRIALKRPVIVSSGCRCKAHNRKEGGGENSQHLPKNGFKAFDFFTRSGIERHIVAEICVKHGASFGVNKQFMHIDVRDTPMIFLY